MFLLVFLLYISMPDCNLCLCRLSLAILGDDFLQLYAYTKVFLWAKFGNLKKFVKKENMVRRDFVQSCINKSMLIPDLVLKMRTYFLWAVIDTQEKSIKLGRTLSFHVLKPWDEIYN